MQVPIDKIIIRARVRKDQGDLTQLVNSMKKYGLLSPVVINKRSELIAGHRRLEAAKKLGWLSIDAVVIDRETELEKLEIELEENIQRKPFTTDELSDGLSRLERLSRPSLFKKIFEWLKRIINSIFGRKKL